MRRELGMLVALIVLCGVIWMSNDDFVGRSNSNNTVRQIAMLGILAIGSSIVIVTGGIDLSVGAIVGLTGVIIAYNASPTSPRVHPENQPAIVACDPAAKSLPPLQTVKDTGYYALYAEGSTGPAGSAAYLYPGDRFGFVNQGGTNSGVYLTQRAIHIGVPGVVTKILVKDHQVLAADDEIMEISDPQLDKEYADAQKEMDLLGSQYNPIKEEADRAKKLLDDARASNDSKAASLEDAYYAICKKLGPIDKQLHTTKQTLSTLSSAEDALTIRAPFPGELIAPHLLELRGKPVRVGQEIAMLDENHLLTMTSTKYAWKNLGQMKFENAIALAIAIALAAGLVQGLLITKLDLQPFIVTLGGMLALRGVSQTITDSKSISFGSESPFLKLANAGYFPRNDFTMDPMGRLPYVLLICLVVVVVSAYLLHFTVFGRYLFAIGGNRDAANYSGIGVKRVETASYVISAGLAGVAGVCWASYIGEMNHGVGTAYELSAIAACVIGGFSLRGGEGTIFGVLIGTAMINVIINGLAIFQYIEKDQNIWKPNDSWQNIVMGVVILIAVILDQVVHIVQNRRRTKSASASQKAGAVATGQQAATS